MDNKSADGRAPAAPVPPPSTPVHPLSTVPSRCLAAPRPYNRAPRTALLVPGEQGGERGRRPHPAHGGAWTLGRCPRPPAAPQPPPGPGTHRLPEQDVHTKEPTVMFT